MKTQHHLIFSDARRMRTMADACVDLVVTSPPYPMIAMWDELFSTNSCAVRDALAAQDGARAFELMHRRLNGIWDECHRVLKEGGLLCINIGDATRTLDGEFGLYPNHARILQHLRQRGFGILPGILWRKPTNAPNKFMGSGVLPAGAYVTLEHEYILVARKGKRRRFLSETDKKKRRESAMFWEERNLWFSDLWTDLTGTGQSLSKGSTRRRSAAFPFELAYRLINMFSVKGDTVLDPFLGTGTTMLAAMACERNSVGVELDDGLRTEIDAARAPIVEMANSYIAARLQRHVDFLQSTKKKPKYSNAHYKFAVVSAQEREIVLRDLRALQQIEEDVFELSYSKRRQKL
jgi:DNA modification methylase